MESFRESYDAGTGYDEIFASPGVPREHCRAVVDALESLGRLDLREAQKRADLAFHNLGITFTVSSEGDGVERIFPFDLVPRVINAVEWRRVEDGLKQRVMALNTFVQDVYNEQRIIGAGLISREVVFASPNYQPAMRGFTPPRGVWIHVSGIDVVRDADGTLYVLEDNLRTPSGVSYVLQNRQISMRTLPRLFAQSGVRPVDDYTNRLRETVRIGHEDAPSVVLTPGIYNAAYFEHAFLAKQLGVQLVEGRDLTVHHGRMVMKTTRGMLPVGSIYRRVDDDFLDPLNFDPDSQLGVAGLFDVYRSGAGCLVNAIGTGIADDKSIYPYVPEMIRFYLGEEPILANVPTLWAADEKQREHILANMRDLVVKPTNASGGYGVVVGPASDERTLAALAEKVSAHPEGFVAQPLIRLSTCPTVVNGRFVPRRVDLRPFVIFDGTEPWVLPGGLTRVALQEGSYIVNSSQGGGSKDTWVLDGAA